MLEKLCPGCRRIIPVGAKYCERCQVAVDEAAERRRKELKRKADRKYDAKRDPKYRAFYNSVEWRTLSRAKLIAAGYQCERCRERYIIALAEEVHHKQPIQTPEGWARRFDMDNLLCVCTKCHNDLHGRFRGRGYKKV